jgi:type III secretory pathway component EscR
MWITLLEISATIIKISIIFVKQKKSKMKNLSIKEIKSIQQTAIAQYKENIQKDGTSKTADFFANTLMKGYDNAIIEDGLVTGYYFNGFKNIPSLPKYL